MVDNTNVLGEISTTDDDACCVDGAVSVVMLNLHRHHLNTAATTATEADSISVK